MSAIYSVILRGNYFANQVLNVWHYVAQPLLGDVPTALKLLVALGFIPEGDPAELPNGTVFANIRGLANSSVAWTEVECRNLYSNTDFYLAAYSPAVQGLASGVPATPTLALGLRSNRVRTDIRRGFKRFVGVTEEQMTTGGALTSGTITLLAGLADAMSANVAADFSGDFFPSIPHFQPYETPSGKTAYKQYASEADQLANTAIGVSWAGYDFVRTQTTRQYGRGS